MEIKNKATRLYAAYGSNMCIKQMMTRCPGAKKVGNLYLPNFALTLPFYADMEKVRESMGIKTPIGLWEINRKDEATLDIAEGVAEGSYYKTDINVELNSGKFPALVYLMTEKYKKSNGIARVGYNDIIKQGYRDFGFDDSKFNPLNI